MTATCAICGKSSTQVWRRIKLRGKYNPTIKRKQRPNLQWARLSTGERAKICTKCMKAKAKGKGSVSTQLA